MSDPIVLANWCGHIDNLQASTKEFYTSVANGIRKRSVPDCEIITTTLKEGGLFSSSREYLRVKRKDLYFDICGAPFGSYFFVSWWLVGQQDSGGFLKSIFRPDTYYKIDTASMFRTTIHDSIMQVIDEMTKAKGIRAMTESERKPVLRDFFNN